MIGMRVRGALAVVGLAAGLVAGAGSAHAGPQSCSPANPFQPTAELFATDSTATITDPNDPRVHDRLEGFELDVDRIELSDYTLPVGSTLVSGVFWSDTQKVATYEASRDFRLACADSAELHRVADQVRVRYHQESVLTFEPRPAGDPARNAFIVEVPGVDITRFHDALVADPDARTRLGGGSITENHTLILVADLADLGLTRRFLTGLGANWDPNTIRYGEREFVG